MAERELQECKKKLANMQTVFDVTFSEWSKNKVWYQKAIDKLLELNWCYCDHCESWQKEGLYGKCVNTHKFMYTCNECVNKNMCMYKGICKTPECFYWIQNKNVYCDICRSKALQEVS